MAGEITRLELYLSKAAGNDVKLPEKDITRIEQYLRIIAENGGGSSVTVDDELSTTSTNPVQNKVITNALNGKATVFTGTLAEWNALSPAEKAGYSHIFTTDIINTLSGYGITDAYTKAEVDALLSTETATTLFDGTVPNAAYKAALVESILLYKRLCILLYIDDSKDYVHVSEISVKALEDAYDLDVAAGKGAHFFVNAEEGTVTTGFMAVDKTSDGKTADFTRVRINGLANARVKIIGIK